MNSNQITLAIEIAGLHKLAAGCGVTYQAVRKWEKAGTLPRTEWTGETNYAKVIVRLTKGQVTRKSLLQPRKSPISQEDAA